MAVVVEVGKMSTPAEARACDRQLEPRPLMTSTSLRAVDCVCGYPQWRVCRGKCHVDSPLAERLRRIALCWAWEVTMTESLEYLLFCNLLLRMHAKRVAYSSRPA